MREIKTNGGVMVYGACSPTSKPIKAKGAVLFVCGFCNGERK